jgi:toxin ParE1/3/4
MKRRRIVYSSTARQDLRALTKLLIETASTQVAKRYLDRVKARVMSLQSGSERGSIRDQASGLRVIGLLPNLSVAFFVEREAVIISRVIYGGQDWQAALSDADT